jgi:hypothetical protein
MRDLAAAADQIDNWIRRRVIVLRNPSGFGTDNPIGDPAFRYVGSAGFALTTLLGKSDA